ncbi:MAG: hypothetical protein RIS87_938, partial [Pseudomonadota bacterium]
MLLWCMLILHKFKLGMRTSLNKKGGYLS